MLVLSFFHKQYRMVQIKETTSPSVTTNCSFQWCKRCLFSFFWNVILTASVYIRVDISVYSTMRRLKTRDQFTRVENAGLENAGPSCRWVENARPVAMERQWYQCCKTEMDVVVRSRKRKELVIFYMLYKHITDVSYYRRTQFIQKKIHVTDTERVKKPTENQNASKYCNFLRTRCILFHTKLLLTYTKAIKFIGCHILYFLKAGADT